VNTKLNGIISSAKQQYREDLKYINRSNAFDMHMVTQTAAPTVNNGVIVTLDKDTVWTVAGTSYVTSLTIDEGAVVQAPVGKKLMMFVNTVATEIKPGKYVGKVVLVVGTDEAEMAESIKNYYTVKDGVLTLSIDKLGDFAGVQLKKGPMGPQRVWDKKSLQRATELAAELKGKAAKVELHDWHRCSSWVPSAIVNAIRPETLEMIVPSFRGDDNEERVVVPVAQMGPDNPQSDTIFEVIDDTDKAYVRYCHRTKGNDGHAFDLSLVKYTTVPEVPAGKPVYLYGVATNTNIVPMALKYAETAPEVWMMYNAESGFTCAIANDASKVGDYVEDTKFRFWAPENRPEHP
jgi:hypothetical protein